MFSTILNVQGIINLLFFSLILLEINAALVFAFTAFFVYEQYEAEIDGLVKIFLDRIKEVKRLLMRQEMLMFFQMLFKLIGQFFHINVYF